jgi:hypothetical protein
MYTLEERIQDCNKWHNHILRMDSSRLAKKIMNFQPDRKRNVGQPRRQWKNSVCIAAG